MLGVFIASTEREVENLQLGNWGHDHFFQVLSSLRPPLSRQLHYGLGRVGVSSPEITTSQARRVEPKVAYGFVSESALGLI